MLLVELFLDKKKYHR